MNTRRFATSCRSIVLAGCTLALSAAIGPTGVEPTGAASIMDGSPVPDGSSAQGAQPRPQPALASLAVADASAADNAGAAAPVPSETIAAPAAPPIPDAKQPAIRTAMADPADMLPDQTAAEPPRELSTRDILQPSGSAAVSDDCFFVDSCVDDYLWTLYRRAPKEDKMAVREQRTVTVKRKRKMVTVTRTFTRLVDEDFAWKDQAASRKAGMAMRDYVIGGMDPGFKLKLFQVLQAADAAGLVPGITSAFRDDYRQSIASGLKAASNRSYHGGSLRGGYGHGLAADIVSVKGATRTERWASTEVLWKWIDAHGKEFGIGRPYLSYDPPHVGPTDGQEYVSRRGGDTTRQAKASLDTPKRLAARRDHGSVKRAKLASVKASRVRSARNSHARTT